MDLSHLTAAQTGGSDPTTTPSHTKARRPRHRRSLRGPLAALGAAIALLLASTILFGGAATSAAPVPTTYSVWPSTAVPQVSADPDTQSTQLGVRFQTAATGWITAIRFYKSPANTGAHTGRLWNAAGSLVGTATFTGESAAGWQQAKLVKPVRIVAGSTYVASYTAPHGRYADDVDSLSPTKPKVSNALTATQGVYSYGTGFPNSTWRNSNYYVDVVFTTADPTGSATPTTAASSSTRATTSSTTKTSPSATSSTVRPTSTQTVTSSTTRTSTSSRTTTTAAPAPTGWPGTSNTGVPAGTVLTKYRGPCTITIAMTITNVDALGCGQLIIATKNVTITKSLLPRVESTYGDGDSSVTLADSTVRAGAFSDGAIWGYNITAARVNVSGGQHSFHCNDNCTLTDSWLHDQYNPAGLGYHNNAFISNGGSNMVIRHNTLHCTAILNSTNGGCTADVSLFGDFDPITNVTVENNLLKANNSSISYCAYGGYSPAKAYPIATGIRFINNVFERGANRKCGVYGPVTSFQSSATGNYWSGNKFDDGVVINPA